MTPDSTRTHGAQHPARAGGRHGSGEDDAIDAGRRSLLLAGFGALAGFLPACRGRSARIPKEGDRFPEVALPTLDGGRESLSSHGGIALLVHFWATWCEPCRREIPDLEVLRTMFDPRDFRIIAISVDDDLDLVREFRLAHPAGFAIWSDADRRLSDSVLGIRAFPTSYLLRRDHSIARVVVGEHQWSREDTVKGIETAVEVRRASRNLRPLATGSSTSR